MNVWMFAILLVALTAPVVAGNTALQAAAQARPAEHDVWVDRLLEARESVEDARERVAKSRVSYSRMRARNKLRGEKRQELTAERDSAARDIEAAEARLERLLEEARRAGVPPGWIREAMAGFAESPAAAAE